MHENLERGQEENSPKIEKLTSENKEQLIDLRIEIDEISVDKAIREAEKYTSQDNLSAFISIKDRVPVGYVEVNLDENSLVSGVDLSEYSHLSRVGVLESERGKGIGSSLMQKSEDWTRENNRKGIWLEYRSDNEPAMTLYNKNGYKEVGKFTDEKGRERVVVKKDI